MSKNEKLLITLLAIIAIAVCIYFYKKSKAVTVPPKTTIIQPTQFVDISKLLIPIAKASIHGASPGANTSILGADLIPTNPPCLFRTMICLGGAAIFYADFKQKDAVSTMKFNSGTALTADAVYMFDILVHSEDTVNLKVDTGVVIKELRVQELVGGLQ